MRISTAFSTFGDSQQATHDVFAALIDDLGGDPDFIVLASTVGYDLEIITSTLSELAPDTSLHGCTSSRAVLTEQGFHSEDGLGLALMGICDPTGTYGTAAAPLGDAPGQAAADSVLQALKSAGRIGELPQLIWLTAPPGEEEKIIAGIEDLLGTNIPIIGGSSADDLISGNWRQIANEQVHRNSVVVSALFPSTACLYAFHSGYEPTIHNGIVTSAQGRILKTIDDRPAAEVYNEWTDGLLPVSLFDQDDHAVELPVTPETSLHPFGRGMKTGTAELTYLLSTARAVDRDGAIHLLGEISTGDEITLMKGTRESLIQRAGRVTLSAMDLHGKNSDGIAGGLIIFCAGCMHVVEDHGDQVTDSIIGSIGDKPFLGSFTSGEQGRFYGGQNRHGNLMIAVLLFSSEPATNSIDEACREEFLEAKEN